MTNETKRVVFIIGATGGIGRALSVCLSKQGVTVVAAGRHRDALDSLSDATGAEGVELDARDIDATKAAVESAAERHGRLDGAVNLAGSLLLKSAHATSGDEWDQVIATNLRTAFGLVRAAAPTMARFGGGSVVLLSSVAARVGLMNHEAIAAAKAGVIGLTLASAATYAPKNVRINAIAPGLVETPLTMRLLSSDAARKASEALHPLGRVGTPEHIASTIAWLLASDQSWITGQVIGVDGGLGSLRGR